VVHLTRSQRNVLRGEDGIGGRSGWLRKKDWALIAPFRTLLASACLASRRIGMCLYDVSVCVYEANRE
jgi:hypothetical protein